MNADVLDWTVQQMLAGRQPHVGDCSSGAATVIQWARGAASDFTPEHLVNRFGWSRAHVLRILRELKDAGLIVPLEHDGQRFVLTQTT